MKKNTTDKQDQLFKTEKKKGNKQNKHSQPNIKEDWETFKKPKKLRKTKKTITLKSQKGKESFPLYFDETIGIKHKFQKIIHQHKQDDDYETDEEQLALTRRYCLVELEEGLDKEFLDSSVEYMDSEVGHLSPLSSEYKETIFS